MGIQETASRKRSKRNELRTIILQTVQAASVISVAVVAPNVVGAMVKLGLVPSLRQKDVVLRSSKRLVKEGCLEWKGGVVRLTKKGERLLRMLTIQKRISKKPRRWDTKWRVLIFDIPEKRKALRVRLREILRLLGFVRLQDSVWAYPYDCEDLVALLKADLHVGDDVRYLIVDSIERDRSLRNHFGL